MTLNDWFEKGLTKEEYIDTLDQLREGFFDIYDNFTLIDDESFFNQLKDKNIRTIMLAEVWCGHCMLNIPIFLRLADKISMPVSILPRDENLELMDQYLTNDKRIIPIFIFIDQKGNEVGKWGPMSETTREFVDQYKKKLPPRDAEDFSEKQQEMFKITTRAFREDKNLWQGVYESLKNTLMNI